MTLFKNMIVALVVTVACSAASVKTLFNLAAHSSNVKVDRGNSGDGHGGTCES